MQVLVILVSSNRLVCSKFLNRQHQILRANYLPKALADQISFIPCVFNPNTEQVTLDEFLLEKLENSDAAAMLLDTRFSSLTKDYESALFVGPVDLSEYIENVQNVLTGTLSKLLRNLGHLLIELQDSTKFQAAALPLRNFMADELNELATACRLQTLEGNFPSQIQPPLNRLTARRGPKRRSSYPTRYFKDDREVYFQYGYEHHSRFETGKEHKNSCHINGLFRFGRRLESERHFNVTKGDSDSDRISEVFQNCHSQDISITNRSHVNMFSNDFHK